MFEVLRYTEQILFNYLTANKQDIQDELSHALFTQVINNAVIKPLVILLPAKNISSFQLFTY